MQRVEAHPPPTLPQGASRSRTQSQKVVEPRKMPSRLSLSPATRLLARDRKATTCPSPLMDGTRLSPLAEGGEGPLGRLAKAVLEVQVAVVVLLVRPRQVLRT